MAVNAVMPPAFFTKNRAKLAKALPQNSMAVLFSSAEKLRNGDQNYPYHQDPDFFYLTGIQQEHSALVIYPDYKYQQYKEVLFIRDITALTDLWEGVKLRPGEASSLSGIQTVKFMSKFPKFLETLSFDCDKIYLDRRGEQDESPLSGKFNNTYVKLHCPLHGFGRLAPILHDFRLQKAPEELLVTFEACKLTGEAFGRILRFVKPDLWEYQVEAEMTHEFLMAGAREHAFPPIVASGANACSLHYEENKAQMKDGDLLLLDFGVNVGMYASDCSRTIPVNGRFTKRQREMYDAVLRVYRHSFNMMKKGISLLHINRMLQPLWEEEHIKLGLYSVQDLKRQDPANPLYKKYFPHTVSHYIGLDVHDVGDREDPLRGGEIVSCEPGIYVPEEGIGIRIENTVLVTQAEPMDMMSSIPIEADEIEEIMNS